MATMANPQTAEIWKEAQKCRRNLEKKLEQLHKNVGHGNENAYLDALDEALSTFRLGSMATVFTDFEFATQQRVDKFLWQAHAVINNKYRSVLSTLSSKSQPKVVLHRQVEKKYAKFLRTSQYFYKGYFQRLSARYQIPELERVAKSMKTDGVPLDEITRECKSGLEGKVLRSCHSILLHLGDLARYRLQTDRKSHGPEKPLAYYRLAHDLIPTSGYGHHQMAVVFLAEKDRDLSVVYHLYRALAVQEPHPNALQNLEVEFKKLRPSSPPRGRNASLDPQITLASWFVRLQAIFYTGESVTQQKELEGEVLHRLQMLLVTKDSFELLLMMVLTNITAYHVARQRAQKQWSAELSQSCQFILGFNVRMILAISRVLMKEVQGALKSIPPDAATPASESTKESERFLATMAAAVPLLRIYLVWLCFNRADLVRYAGHLSHIIEMHQSLAETISLLIEVFRLDTLGVSTVEYMLAEDVETIGFDPLSNEDAPYVCRSLHFTPDGKAKRRLEDGNSDRLLENLETLCRINDIINCGYFLGTDPQYPLAVTQTQIGSQFLTTLSYMDSDTDNDSRITMGKSMDGSKKTPTADPATPQKIREWLSPACPNAVADEATGEQERAMTTAAIAPQSADNRELDESTETDFGVDGDTLDRINDFLMPPEPVKSPKSPKADESSYGMHSSTANEIFAALDPASMTPNSASRRAFPTLPWELIYTPTPYRSAVPATALDSLGVQADADLNQHKHAHSSGIESPLSQRPTMGPRALEPLREQAKRAAERHAAASQLPNRDLTIGETYDKERMEEVAKLASWKVDQRHHPIRVPASSMPPSTIPASSSLHSLSSLSNHSPGRPGLQQTPGFAPGPYFQSSNFSPNASGLPQVNSPWGLPPAVRARSISQHQQVDENYSDPAQVSFQPSWTASSPAWGPSQARSKDSPGQLQNLCGSPNAVAAADVAQVFDKNTLLKALGEQ